MQLLEGQGVVQSRVFWLTGFLSLKTQNPLI